jgi:CheY-like chemotaxis protein
MTLEKTEIVILLAEDEAVVRNVVYAVLSTAGYQVLPAVDGAAALEVSRAYDGVIHLLLTDINMPNLKGTELARALSEERPGIRILMMTGTVGEVTEALRPPLLPNRFAPANCWSAFGGRSASRVKNSPRSPAPLAPTLP